MHINGALALRTIRTQLVAAVRAETEAGLKRLTALGAVAAQGQPQYEVENDAKSIRNNQGYDRPQRRTHATTFRVAIDVTKQQDKQAAAEPSQQAQEWPRPRRRSIGMMVDQDKIKEQLRGYKTDSRQHPGYRGNDLDFFRHPASRFVSLQHNVPHFLITASATRRRGFSHARRELTTER
jgi:hypothetical protein